MVRRALVGVWLSVLVACAESQQTSPSAPDSAATASASPAIATVSVPVPPTVSVPVPPTSNGMEAAPPPASSRRAYVVAAMGDSLTDARSHGGKFLDYLKQHCPESRFDNYGVGGQMVNQMRRRFERDILGGPKGSETEKPAYTHVIVFGGVNDIYSDETAHRGPKLVQADLGAMYAMAKARGIKVVALTVAPWGGFTQYFNAKRSGDTAKINEWIRTRKEAGEVEYVVDAFALLSCGDPNRLCPELAAPFKDGLHFGPKGHEKLGEVMRKEIFSDCQ